MINYEKFILPNGLKVIVHSDATSPMVAMSVLYDVGAKDEDENKTGFAHLFEHLMFGGSVHIPEYDEPLQNAGGAFSKKSLDVQRKVVCEEFKEHYINKPYGDVWENLRAMCYTTHPYKWQTIGKQLKHIEDATLQDVKSFFGKHYNPMNAMLCVAGNVSKQEVESLCNKYFASIPSGEKYTRNLPAEPKQTEARKMILQRDVPVNALYKAYHIGGRLQDGYHAIDLLTEILSGGQSSILHVQLVKQLQLFTQIDCYHMGSIDPSLLVIEGKVANNVSMEEADAAIEKCIADFLQNNIAESDLQKAINKTESMIAFEDLSLLNRANNLLYYELLGDAAMMNTELGKYEQVTAAQILHFAKLAFRKENSNTLWYLSKQ
jgi:zinc protease